MVGERERKEGRPRGDPVGDSDRFPAGEGLLQRDARVSHIRNDPVEFGRRDGNAFLRVRQAEPPAEGGAAADGGYRADGQDHECNDNGQTGR